MKKANILLFVVALFFSINSCKKEKEEDNIEPINEIETIDDNNFTKLTEGTVIVDPTEIQTDVTENKITIVTSTEKIQNLKVGQIIVSGRTENAPNGYARKITEIENNGNSITFHTVQAGIDEVYKELSIDTKIEVDYENFKPIHSRGSGKSSKSEPFRPIDLDYNASTNKFEIGTVLYDADGDYNTENDQITYEGSLQIVENSSSFIFNIRPGTQKIFHLSNEMELKTEHSLGISTSLSLNEERFEIAKIPLTMTLPTSFVINAYLKLTMGIEGNITGSISLDYEAALNTIAALSYDETNGWIHPNAASFNSETSFDGNVEMELKPSLSPGLAIEFVQYNNASAGVYLNAYVKFHAEPDEILNINWDFGYGLELEAEAEVSVLNTFIDVDFGLVIWERPYQILYQGIYYLSSINNMIPENTATVATKSITFSWESNNFIIPATYQIFLGTTESNMDIVGETTENHFELNENLENNTYFWKIVAVNTGGSTIISQSNLQSFDYIYIEDTPTVTTTPIENITETAASSGGNITDEGGSDIIERGVCWNTTPNPTIANNFTNDGTGTGSYTSSLTNLSTATLYYVRAYARNNEGTAYGNQEQFSTSGGSNNPPTASFTVNPSSGSTSTIFSFDGLACTDPEDPTSDLQVRWDFDGDGNWDTDWDYNKTESHQYNSENTYATKLEVKDSEGLTDQYTKNITVSNDAGLGTFTDPRDGQTYNTVTIGNQIWFAENLNYEMGDSWWYDNNNSNGDIYGRLYTWVAALNACPSGWHLPTDDEWKTMEMYLGMSQSETDNIGWRGTDEGEKMKSTSGWGSNYNGTNSSGFNALPGGYFNGNDWFFTSISGLGYWWSSTETSGTACNRSLYYNGSQVNRNFSYKSFGFSVRCIKD